MAIYHLGFSKKLIQAARYIFKDDCKSIDAKRTVAYLSRLSYEIILKALLEKAKMPIKKIRAYSHDLDKLHKAMCFCEIWRDVGNGKYLWVAATGINCITILPGYMTTTGNILSDKSVSIYPNEIRYGEIIHEYDPEILLLSAEKMLKCAYEYLDTIRVKV